MDELKVTLYGLWRIGGMEGRVHYLREQDFAICLTDPSAGEAPRNPAPALEKAVQRGSLLQVKQAGLVLYFLNSPRGRAAAQAFAKGQWHPEVAGPVPAAPGTPEYFQTL